MNEVFLQDVIAGLRASPKTLPSKYFYNSQGDELFAKIMHLPEYYLTRAEMDIFQNKTADLIQALGIEPGTYFELVELGAGDGLKTKQLLAHLLAENYDFQYLPIDISDNVLQLLESSLRNELPGLNINTRHGDYFQILHEIQNDHHPKVVLFLGSNIGNMLDEEAQAFVKELNNNMSAGDKLILGVDLIKSEAIVAPAYNDREGVTSAFNLNLLQRINDELDADFDLIHFEHAPEYDQKSGIARSFLKSKIEQQVKVRAANEVFSFKAGEKIATEVSRKYNQEIVEKLIENTDFNIQNKVMDQQQYFADYIISR